MLRSCFVRKVFSETRKGERTDSLRFLQSYRSISIPSDAPEAARHSNVGSERTRTFLPHIGQRGVFAVFINNKGKTPTCAPSMFETGPDSSKRAFRKGVRPIFRLSPSRWKIARELDR